MPGITKRLLEHRHDPEEFESRRFFFCQLEAAETLIWLTGASPVEQVGVDIPSDGGAFARLRAKMATGSGKTVIMAMVIAWHVLDKVTNPRDARFAKNVFVVPPGLTVRSPLAVLGPPHAENLLRGLPRCASRAGRQAAPRQGRNPQLARTQLA